MIRGTNLEKLNHEGGLLAAEIHPGLVLTGDVEEKPHPIPPQIQRRIWRGRRQRTGFDASSPCGDTLLPLPFGYCAGTFPEEHRDDVGGYETLKVFKTFRVWWRDASRSLR